jgi:hypothetical protein
MNSLAARRETWKHGRRRFVLPAALLALLCILAPGRVRAATTAQTPLEYQVKAAFVYKFLKFVEWPPASMPDSSTTIVVGLLGTGPMHDALESVKGKEVSHRRVTVRSVEEADSLASCHVLFIGRGEEARLEEVLSALEGSSTLTIGEISEFAERGGMINFLIEDNKVGFEINPAAAARAHLHISSKLLRLAKVVKEKE